MEQNPSPTTSAPSLYTYFTPPEWLVFSAVVLLGLLLRWLELDVRPYHHDESLHGMYGRYFYDFPDNNFYKYDPMLHGPFLYNMLRVVYSTFGDTLWGARAPITLMGSAFVFMPLLFRRYFSPWGTLGLTAAVALSPSLIYWSRFLREDYGVVCAMLMVLYGAVLAPASRKSLWVMCGLALHLAMKENSYVFCALVSGYLIYELLLETPTRGALNSLAARCGLNLWRFRWQSLLALLIASFVFIYLLSAGFRYPQGPLDGLFRKSISYWFEQHAKERIEGPFLFHIYTLTWYELPFIIAWAVQLTLFYRAADQWIQRAAGLLALTAALAMVWTISEEPQTVFLWKFFRLKDVLDVGAFFLILFHPILLTTQHILRRERTLAFFGYFFTASLFTYSYLGEKVPWLTIYPFIAGLIYLALYFDDYFRRNPLEWYANVSVSNTIIVLGNVILILGLLFLFQEDARDQLHYDYAFVGFGCALAGVGMLSRQLAWLGTYHLAKVTLLVTSLFCARAAMQTNFLYGGHAREYMSQVHTTPEFHELMLRIRHEILNQTPGYKPTVLVTGDGVWPATWYLRDLNEYKFNATPAERANFDYIIENWTDPPKDVPPGFKVTRVNLRGWWVPDFKVRTLKKFLNYSLNHTPWSTTGFSYVNLLVNSKKRAG